MTGHIAGWMRLGLFVCGAAAICGCQAGPQSLPAAQAAGKVDEKVLVSASAAGWRVRPGEIIQGTGHPTTVLVNRQGTEFDVGLTQYPDVAPAYLWRMPVKELRAEFLVLYVPPVASGGSTLTLLRLTPQGSPVWAASIRTHAEMGLMDKETAEARVAMADYPQGRLLRDVLFRDVDGNGIPSLVENDIWKGEGTIKYFHFEGEAFKLAYVEEFKPDKDGRPKLFAKRTASCGG